jgi:formylglycine-generating enzyme required for sulfatase activity
VVLILDALDEVPSRDGLHILARRAVMRLAASTPARILLASRPLGYSTAPLGRYLGPDVAEFELMKFSEGEVARVIQAWFHKRVPLLRRLQIALRRSPTLIDEARNPLLLSFICMLNETRGEDIIANRTLLYEFVLRLLLEGRWRDFGLLMPESRIRAKQRVLELIAWHFSTHRNTWWDHLAGDEIDGALDKLPDAQKLWTTWRTEWGEHYEGPLWELSEWDGILVKGRIAVDGMASAIPYAFLHRTIQEFLVARFLLRRYREAGLAAPEIEEFLSTKIFDPQWYVVVLILIEQAMLLPTQESLPILQRLVEVTLNVANDPNGRLAVAAVEILLKLKQNEVGADTVDALRDRLLDLARDRNHPLALRIHAGRLVAELGDPRAEVVDVDAIEFVTVPAGVFPMGSDPSLDADAAPEEMPPHVATTRSYAISRLPITNAQYRVFLEDANGYSNPAYWAEAIALGHWRDGKVWRLGPLYRADGEVQAEPQWVREPNYMGWPTDLPNVPVMGICWYEARAFARWLEDRWRRLEKISSATRLDLPSEAEWEKAARGLDGRIYPWGNEFDGDRLSWSGQILMAHAPVGLFPDSASPYGAEEMVGNLWEWTRSIFTSYADTPEGMDFADALLPDAKVAIRGGAYFSLQSRCRCAARSATSVNGRTYATIRLVMVEE